MINVGIIGCGFDYIRYDVELQVYQRCQNNK